MKNYVEYYKKQSVVSGCFAGAMAFIMVVTTKLYGLLPPHTISWLEGAVFFAGVVGVEITYSRLIKKLSLKTVLYTTSIVMGVYSIILVGIMIHWGLSEITAIMFYTEIAVSVIIGYINIEKIRQFEDKTVDNKDVLIDLRKGRNRYAQIGGGTGALLSIVVFHYTDDIITVGIIITVFKILLRVYEIYLIRKYF